MRFIVIKLKYVLFALFAVVAVSAVLLTPRRAITTFLSGGRELPIYSVDRDDNKLALPFDCAWGAEDIDSVIDTLIAHNACATFFVTGKWAEENSVAINRLYRSGFELGIHSYDHNDYSKMSAEAIKADIERCAKIIQSMTGSDPRLVRVPSGAYNDTAIKAVEDSGRMCIQWSVDGIDYVEDADTVSITGRVVSEAGTGDIILLHTGTEFTASALGGILDALSEYDFVNVSELIYTDNFIIDHTGKQIRKEFY